MRFVVAIVLVAACAPQDHSPADASVPDSSTPDAFTSSPFEPGCMWECFGHQFCEDGIVHQDTGVPVACGQTCSSSELYTCEQGCRAGAITGRHDQDPSILCEETRPRAPDEPCNAEGACPLWEERTRESVDRHHFTCDASTLTCVAIDDPIVPGWLEPCDQTFTSEPGIVGFVRDSRCGSGLCGVGTSTCERSGCTITCEHNSDCPDGSFCELTRDHTDLLPGGEDGPPQKVCWPVDTSVLPCR